KEFTLEARLADKVPGLKLTQQPLVGSQVDDVSNVQCGYRIYIEKTPETPEGFFSDTLVLKFKPPDEKKPQVVTLPVGGTVKTTSLETRPSQIEFTKANLTDADSKTLLVQLRAPVSENETIKVIRREPSFLQTDEPKQIKKGLWEIKVRIPAN